jgi:hypothetical protein
MSFQLPEEKIKICKKLFKLFDEDGDEKEKFQMMK